MDGNPKKVMVERWQAQDGSLHDCEQAAKDHEFREYMNRCFETDGNGFVKLDRVVDAILKHRSIFLRHLQ